MFLGAMDQNRTLTGFYTNGLFFGPRFLVYRHAEISQYFSGHRTAMTIEEALEASRNWPKGRLSYPDVIPSEDQIKASRDTLLMRCYVCRKNHLRAKRESKAGRAAVLYTVDVDYLLGLSMASNHERTN